MDKRVLTTIAVSVGILLFWMVVVQPRLAPPPPPKPAATAPAEPAAPPPVAAAAKPTDTKPADTKPAEIKPANAKPVEIKPANAKPVDTKAADAKAKPVEVKVAEPERPEVFDTLEMPGLWHARFTSHGAVPLEWTLLDAQYQEPIPGQKTLRPINLVRTEPTWLPLMTTFVSKDFDLPTTAAWKREAATATELVYSWDSERVHVEKHYTVVPGSYQIHTDLTVTNKSDKPVDAALHVYVHGRQDPNAPAPSFFNPVATQTLGLCDVKGKLESADWKKLGGKPIELDGPVRWVGIDEKFFVVAVGAGVSEEARHCAVTAGASHYVSADLARPSVTIAPGAKQVFNMAGYFGPKLLHDLDGITVGGADAKMGTAIDYGYFFVEIIARPMLAVLKAFHHVLPNWGVAIIVLTLLIYAVTWWPTQTSVKSMRAMSKLKPELDKLKAKYGEDRQGFAMAQMKLFKERGVSPFAGCLPTVIQIPIYIALFSMLRNSVELYRSPFIAGWISDLTAPDPFFAMPIVAGALTLIQQRFSPPPTDPNQRMMMYAAPIMFIVFTIFLPAGLALYTLTRSILSLAQYYVIYRADKGTTQTQTQAQSKTQPKTRTQRT